MMLTLGAVIAVEVLSLSPHIPNAQAAASCTSVVSGSWSSPSTWINCGGSFPGAGDSATIAAGHTVTVDVDSVAATVNVNNGAAAASLLLMTGKTLTVSGAITITNPTNNSSTTTLAVDAGNVFAGSMTIVGNTNARASQLTIGTGTITVTDSLTFSGTAINARVIFTDNGTLNIGANLGNGGTLTTSGLGTINFNGSVAQTIGAYTTYNNVAITNAGGGVTFNGTTTIGGDLLINSGTLDTGTISLVVSGVTTVAGVLKISSTTGAKTFNSDITIASGGIISVTATETLTANGNLTINNGGTMSFSAAGIVTLGGNLAINGTGSITGTTGLWTFSKIGGGTIGGTTTTAQSIGSATFTTDYSNNIALTVTGATTVNLSSTLTNNGTFTANGTMRGETATFKQGSGGILNIGSTMSMATLEASAMDNQVRYTNTAGAQTIKGATYRHLVIDKAGQTASVSGAWNVLGNLTVTTNSTLALGTSVLVVSGTTTIHGLLTDINPNGSATFGGPVTVASDGSWSHSNACNFNFKNGLVFNGSNFVSGTGVYSFSTNNQSIAGSSPIIINNVVVVGVTLTNAVSNPLTVSTSLSGSGTLAQVAGATLRLGGATPIARIDAHIGPNTVDYNGSKGQTVVSATYSTLVLGNKIRNGAYIDLDNSGSVTPGDRRVFIGNPVFAGLDYTVGSLVVSGDSDIGAQIALPSGTKNIKKTGQSGTTFVYGSDGLYIDNDASDAVTPGDIRVVVGDSVANGLGYDAGSTVRIGNSDVATGIVLPTGVNIKKTGIDAVTPSPSVPFVYQSIVNDSMAGDVMVTKSLFLGSTKLATGANKMILETDTVLSRTTGYVIGTIKKNFNSSTSFTYPLGDATSYTPIDLTLSGVTGSGSIDGSVANIDHPDITLSGLDSTKSVNRFWSLTNNNLRFANYAPVFHFVSTDVDDGVAVANIRVAQKSGKAWAVVPAQCLETSCSLTGLRTMSDFQIGERTTPRSGTSVPPLAPPSAGPNLPELAGAADQPPLFDIVSNPLRSAQDTLILVIGGAALIGLGLGSALLKVWQRWHNRQLARFALEIKNRHASVAKR